MNNLNNLNNLTVIEEVLEKDARKTLFDLLSEYTKTPIEDR